MAGLRAVFTELGCTAVATYIQSGNAVCTAPASLTSAAIAAAIGARFGFAVPVVLRTLAEIESLIEQNPFAAAGAPGEHLHAVFLEAPPEAATLGRLQSRLAGEEQLAVRGRELLLLLPHGSGRSKLAMECTAAWMPGSPTVRNWKTVLALDALLRA